MIRLRNLLPLLALLLMLAGCRGKQATDKMLAGDTLQLRYARQIVMVNHKDYTEVVLRNPWDTTKVLHRYVLVPRNARLPKELPHGTLLRTPLERVLAYSSVHACLMDELGVRYALAGVCDLQYIKTPFIQEGVKAGRITDCGGSVDPDIERVIDLKPDAILLSPFEGSGGYGRIEKLGIPLVECADYMEVSPLARAEWVRFYGLLFGREELAERMFDQTESNYASLRAKALATDNRPTVTCDLLTGSTWYVPGGRSTTGMLMADAGARYVFAEDDHAGSLPLSFETVFERSAEADIWIFRYNSDKQDMTYEELGRERSGYKGLKAWKVRRAYGCNTLQVMYFEEVPFHPDYLLEDFIKIFHTPGGAAADSLRYYKPVVEAR